MRLPLEILALSKSPLEYNLLSADSAVYLSSANFITVGKMSHFLSYLGEFSVYFGKYFKPFT